jgi:4-amino-4-deoxy-L-arabinose transferase-like glycosyltransferase
VNTHPLAEFIKAHYPLLGVLIGSFLIAASMGTYTNWDAQIEYEAATATVAQGFPYLSTGLMINQPPFGFYTAAAAFQLFGASYQNAVALSTIFGVAAVALVYALGTLLYGRRTGLVASALFGLVPWHVYMSRIFLIDNQYLFWSLLFLVLGVLSVRRNSDKLILARGMAFALALLTKLFTVFALVPMLLLIYFAKKEGKFQCSRRKLLIFLLPVLVSQAIWYGGFAHQNFSAVYFSTDFSHPVYVSDPSLLFLSNVWGEAVGVFLFAAAVYALVFGLVYRSTLKRHIWMDLICFLTVSAVASVNLLLVFGFHLTVPYVSVFKYTYMALPFLCLLAGSVADKGALLLSDGGWKNAKAKWIKPVLVAAGLLLIFASLVESIQYLGVWLEYTSFGVDTVTYYPIDNYAETAYGSSLHVLQYGALALVVLSLFFVPNTKTAAETIRTRLRNKNNPE